MPELFVVSPVPRCDVDPKEKRNGYDRRAAFNSSGVPLPRRCHKGGSLPLAERGTRTGKAVDGRPTRRYWSPNEPDATSVGCWTGFGCAVGNHRLWWFVRHKDRSRRRVEHGNERRGWAYRRPRWAAGGGGQFHRWL